MPLTFTIDRWRPHPLNKLMRTNRHQRNRMIRGDAEVVYYEYVRSGFPPADGPRSVEIQISYLPGENMHDEDAFAKTLLDALTKCTAIVDDSPKWLIGYKIRHVRGKSRSVTFTIYPPSPLA